MEIETAQFDLSKRYEGFGTDVDLHVPISIQDAENLVTEINKLFPDAAKFIQANVRLASKGDVDLQLISIKSTVMKSDAFLEKFSLALDYIAEHRLDLLETFQVASSTRKHTTVQLAESLSSLAEEYKDSSASLSTSLSNFSLFALQRKSKDELQVASFEVEKAVAGHEATIATVEEHKLFKQGKKKEIKVVQEELGTRLKKSQ